MGVVVGVDAGVCLSHGDAGLLPRAIRRCQLVKALTRGSGQTERGDRVDSVNQTLVNTFHTVLHRRLKILPDNKTSVRINLFKPIYKNEHYRISIFFLPSCPSL